MKAPTTASFLTYLTPEYEAQQEVLVMETDTRSMEGAVGVSSPTATAGSFSVKKGGSKRAAPGDIGVMYIPPGGCSKEYIECVYDCLYLRVEFGFYNAEFWRADSEFWENILTGRSYLNRLQGGPQDRLKDNFYQMRQVYNQYKGMLCKNYLR